MSIDPVTDCPARAAWCRRCRFGQKTMREVVGWDDDRRTCSIQGPWSADHFEWWDEYVCGGEDAPDDGFPQCPAFEQAVGGSLWHKPEPPGVLVAIDPARPGGNVGVYRVEREFKVDVFTVTETTFERPARGMLARIADIIFGEPS